MAAPGPAGQQEDVPMVAAANLNAADVPAGNPPVAGPPADSSLETHSSTSVTADTHSNEWALAPDESHGGSPEFATRVKAFVKQVIQDLVNDEDKAKPLSDEQIVKTLAKKNLKIARRTVAKYRGELNILSSNMRKVY